MVSIITPCYNAEAYIADTIQSVIKQTYQDWEMLIVDDCSSDKSREIIAEFQKKDSRIRYFRTDAPSGSPAKPRNIALDNARGDVIAFLDSDDMWLSDKLRIQLDFMRKENVPISYSYYEKISFDGMRNHRIIQTGKEADYNSLKWHNVIPCLTAMARREAIGDTRFKAIPQEDFCFWLDVLKKGYKAKNLCQVTALYRVAENARSANKFKMFKGYWDVLHKQQGICFIPTFFYVASYAFHGSVKYLK